MLITLLYNKSVQIFIVKAFLLIKSVKLRSFGNKKVIFLRANKIVETLFSNADLKNYFIKNEQKQMLHKTMNTSYT